MTSKPLSVSDRPAEVWIKLLVFVTTIALGLVSYIGHRLIEGQDRTTEAVGKINGNVQTVKSRVSRNERDIQELKVFHTNIQNGLKP